RPGAAARRPGRADRARTGRRHPGRGRHGGGAGPARRPRPAVAAAARPVPVRGAGGAARAAGGGRVHRRPGAGAGRGRALAGRRRDVLGRAAGARLVGGRPAGRPAAGGAAGGPRRVAGDPPPVRAGRRAAADRPGRGRRRDPPV
ncbi:MAG: hypothetical protein AVDCRST_MAG41-1550, partial [uncultured Corynebacteriales bacterium]